MTECTQVSFDFPPVKRRRIEARFSGGNIASNGGLLLLRQADRRLGLLEAVNARLPDPRDGRYVRHDQLPLLRQRVYALCQGYEDLNDHDQLRGDLALQTATEQDQVLGSSPTLCRLENHIKEQQLGLFADRTSAHQWWTNQFRLLLSSLAYMLMETIRRLALRWHCMTRNWPTHRSARCGSSYSRSVRSSYAIRAGSAFCCRVPFPIRISSTRPPSGWFQDSP